MIHIGSQYYRPPFPNQKHWEEDFKIMRDTGLNTAQLWVVWAWVEANPGKFNFDDYDRLVEIADKNNIEIVLSTCAELHPLWIHRVIPDCETITHYGHKVTSSARGENHFGLTPGGCFDHPEVWNRMSGFLDQTAAHFKGATNLMGWDAWNELRWNVNSIDRICFCEHTIASFRKWLDEKYGGLDGLNDAWIRRYDDWQDVMPGKFPGAPMTENMAFADFTCWRSCQHGFNRYDIIKKHHPDKPVLVHGGSPSAYYTGSDSHSALSNGNDWYFADHMDGVGTSSFPNWGLKDNLDFSIRMELLASSAQGKRMWLSELQGGRAARGTTMFDSVDAQSQQRWVWNGIACGAETVIFWCWRDEVFTSETAGFGIIGKDGYRDERLAALKTTMATIKGNEALLEAYVNDKPKVGLLFSPQSFFQVWSMEYFASRAFRSLKGYARAMSKLSIPYRIVEEEHLDALDGLDVLILPGITTMGTELQSKLEAFVKAGGTLIAESECGLYAPNGIARDEEERLLYQLTHAKEVGRRRNTGDAIEIQMNDQSHLLPITQWNTPIVSENIQSFADSPEGSMAGSWNCEKGTFIQMSSYPGQAYYLLEDATDIENKDALQSGFENFIWDFCKSNDCLSPVNLDRKPGDDPDCLIKTGLSHGKALVFLFFNDHADSCELLWSDGNSCPEAFKDILSSETYKTENQRLTVNAGNLRSRVLVEE